MFRLGYRLLGIAATGAIAATSLTPALADDVVTTPQQATIDQVVSPAPTAAPNGEARAEVTRTPSPSKPKLAQPNVQPRRVVLAQRENCWVFCGRQMVLMLGVAY
jgi:hypothetical protein